MMNNCIIMSSYMKNLLYAYHVKLRDVFFYTSSVSARHPWKHTSNTSGALGQRLRQSIIPQQTRYLHPIQRLNTSQFLSRFPYNLNSTCLSQGNISVTLLNYCTAPDKPPTDSDDSQSNLSIFQKFKKAYQEQGKVLVVVHVITSAFWFGSFYSLAAYGIDVGALLKILGASEAFASRVSHSAAGDLATAYLLYKLITPLRYAVTLGGTNIVIRKMRKSGRMEPVPDGAKFKDLYEDGKEIIREKRDNLKERREELSDRLRETKENVIDRRGGFSDAIKMRDNRGDVTGKTSKISREKQDEIGEKREESSSGLRGSRSEVREGSEAINDTTNVREDVSEIWNDRRGSVEAQQEKHTDKKARKT